MGIYCSETNEARERVNQHATNDDYAMPTSF